MQLKKAKEIEKARLMREKNVMEARRRARSLVLPLLLKCHCKRCCKDRPPNYVSDEHITKLAERPLD